MLFRIQWSNCYTSLFGKTSFIGFVKIIFIFSSQFSCFLLSSYFYCLSLSFISLFPLDILVRQINQCPFGANPYDAVAKLSSLTTRFTRFTRLESPLIMPIAAANQPMPWHQWWISSDILVPSNQVDIKAFKVDNSSSVIKDIITFPV